NKKGRHRADLFSAGTAWLSVDALSANFPVTISAKTAIGAVEGALGVGIIHQVEAIPGGGRTTEITCIAGGYEVASATEVTPEDRHVGVVEHRCTVQSWASQGVRATGHQEHRTILLALGRADVTQSQHVGLE